MSPVDWWVVALYGAVLVTVGLLQRRRAGGGVADYFVSGRRLRWWAAGTSMVAASFASDTPLLVCALVRGKGLWGNWQWWGLGISTILTVFFFAPLWRRTEVLTDAELTELRYSGRAAAALRGFKAVYWGLLYNCFQAGAWGFAGLVTITTAVTEIGRGPAIFACAGLGAAYALVSGLSGVVAADMVQFLFAIGGAVLTAAFAVDAAGGLGAVVAAAPAGTTDFLPSHEEGLRFVLAALLVQWWAWKNTDGGGVLVQRMAACRDEKEAVKATLWFNVVHYALRCWPWVLVALASLVLYPSSSLPRLADGSPSHQSAYALVIRDVMPAGLRGFVVAWFFAEFMASVAGAMNWGASLFVNDFYRRFLRRGATERHYLRVSRLSTLLVIAGAILTAFLSDDIPRAFAWVLGGTAATGVVLAARWLWWRVNAWSEIAAMIASPVATFLVVPALRARGLRLDAMTELLLVLGVSLVPILAATFLAPPDDPERLRDFYRRARPPGPGWRRIAALCPGTPPPAPLGAILLPWLLCVAGIFSLMIGIGSLLLGRPLGAAGVAAGAALLLLVVRRIRS